VNLIKKSFTKRLWQNCEVDSDFLRRAAGGIRYCFARLISFMEADAYAK
jgi:hypothetical protein